MSKRKNPGYSKRLENKLNKAWALLRKNEAYCTRRAAATAMIQAYEDKVHRDRPDLEDVMF